MSDLTHGSHELLSIRGGSAGGAHRRRVLLLAVLLVATALVPFVQELTAQPAIRYAQTAALVEDQTVELDRYRHAVGVDRVERDGHVYGDKAPLQPILAAPAYATAKLVGAESADHLRVDGNLGLWWVTLWSTVVPLLGIVALGASVGSRLVGSRQGALAAVVMALGSLMAAYGTQLYAHVLAGLLGWACWLAIGRSRGGWGWMVAGGALGGAAVATEYPIAIVVVVCLVVLVRQARWRDLAWFCLGGVPFAALLLGYQWVAYGSPFSVSYGNKPVHDSEPLVVGLPNPIQLLEVLFGSRGIVIFTPVVAVAVWGLWRLAATAGGERRLHGQVGLVVFGLFLLLQSGWSNPWGGEAPGPRYLVPALPFLIVGLAEAWQGPDGRADTWAKVRRVVVAWSVFAMATTVVADHLVAGDNLPVASHLQHLRDVGPVETLWTLAIGPVGWVIHGLSVIAAFIAFSAALSEPDVAGGAPVESERAASSA